MDTVDRKRLGYKMQLYLTRLTHNGHFFYYDSFFVIIMNAVTEDECEEILDAFSERTQKKMPSVPVYIGVSDIVSDITNLHIAYRRARSAGQRALRLKKHLQYFNEMGIYRLLYSVRDKELLQQMAEEMYVHRNTILYRMAAIRKLLNCPLETTEERLPYIIAFKIWEM